MEVFSVLPKTMIIHFNITANYYSFPGLLETEKI